MSASLKLSDIRLDGGTQIRSALYPEHIEHLVEAFEDGVQLPPVVVFHDGTSYWLGDGFHRLHAAQKCGLNDILADVRSGTRLDAVRHALSANATHGLPRTNADKRRAVEIALKEFPKLSSREIAKICAVGHQLVGSARPQVDESSTSTKRLGGDGKIYTVPARIDRRTASSKGLATAMARPTAPEPMDTTEVVTYLGTVFDRCKDRDAALVTIFGYCFEMASPVGRQAAVEWFVARVKKAEAAP